MGKKRYFLVILPLLLAIWLVANLELGGRVLGGQEEEREGDLLASRKQNYQRWFERLQEQTEVIETFAVKDLNAVPVKYWEEIGGPAAYIRLTGYEMTDAIVMEIPPKGSLKRHRHIYEENILVLSGQGYTELQQKDRRIQRLQWQKRSYFVPPLNSWHQHFNTGSTPARLLAVTAGPLMVNIFGDRQLSYSLDYALRDRYDAEEDFARVNDRIVGRFYKRNFVEDVLDVFMPSWEYRGRGNRTVEWVMGSNNMTYTHMSEFPIGMYKKAHRHWGEAILYIVTGKGYTLIWEEGKFNERQRANWQANSLIGVPPGVWYHQHFNTGREPARYIAFRGARGLPGRTADSRVIQIEHEDESPLIREEYMKEIAREGIEFKMRDIFEK